MEIDVKWLLEEESGQGMVEYSLILALVAIGVIGAVKLFGDGTLSLYEKAISKFPTN